jgi:hypothetical protein
VADAKTPTASKTAAIIAASQQPHFYSTSVRLTKYAVYAAQERAAINVLNEITLKPIDGQATQPFKFL